MVVIETLTPAVKLINTSAYDDERGFLTMSELSEIQPKYTGYPSPVHKRCIPWKDTKLAIDLSVLPSDFPLLSEKAAKGQKLMEAGV